MLNQTILVGRLTSDPTVKKLDNGKEVSNLTLAVQRSFKNAEGEYDVDFVDVILWDAIAKSTSAYCKKGDLVGVKGRLQVDSYENDKGEKRKNTQVVAEKVTFLSSKSKENDDEVEEEKDAEQEIEM